MATPAAPKFTLRFHNRRNHELLGLLAEHFGVTKNQLAEQMLERELQAAALLMEQDLTGTLALLRKYRRDEHLPAAIEAFAQAEAAEEDPIKARMVDAASTRDSFGVEDAFGQTVPTAWEDDPADAPRLAANAAKVLTGIARYAEKREPPTVAMAQQWHRDLYAGIAHRYDDYVGETDVGNALGVRSELVPQALQRFEHGAQTAASRLDAAIEVGADPSAMAPRELHSVLTFCALLHGNWVRIHPFANGNGRTARLWANWAALRYGLPPFVTIKPRPGHPYGAAAAASMAGDDQMMVAVMEQMLRDSVS